MAFYFEAVSNTAGWPQIHYIDKIGMILNIFSSCLYLLTLDYSLYLAHSVIHTAVDHIQGFMHSEQILLTEFHSSPNNQIPVFFQ